MKKRISLMVLLLLTFSLVLKVEHISAEENNVPQVLESEITCRLAFLNSQDPIGEDLLNLVSVNWNDEAEVRDDGGYQYGEPGVYNVTYGITGTEVEETFAITVVESKGTLLDIEIETGNTFIVDKLIDLGILEQLDDYVINNVKAKCLIEKENGELIIVESELTNSFSGVGGIGGYYITANYVPIIAKPYYSHPKDPNDVEYYNPVDDVKIGIEESIGLLEKGYINHMKISDAANTITIEGNIGRSGPEETIVKAKMNHDITSMIVGTDKFSAYTIEIVDKMSMDAIHIPIPNGEFRVSMQIPDTLVKENVSVYKMGFDRNLENINSTLNGERIEFITNKFPATIVLVEEKTEIPSPENPEEKPEEKPTISSGANSIWKQNSAIGITIKSSADFSSFIGVMVDGQELDKKYYTVSKGSIVVQLNPEYLSTLTTGTHSITILSTQGDSDTIFHITKEDKKENIDKVETSDNTSPMMMMSLMGLSMCICILLSMKKRKKQL